MNADLDALYEKWTEETGKLKWGVQKMFRDVLTAAQDGKTTLVYGADYGYNGACLVNTIGVALTTGGGPGIPSQHFRAVVSLFDQINSALYVANANDKAGIVSPLAADILLSHFAEDKVPEPGSPEDNADIGQLLDTMKYQEPSDEEMESELAKLFMATEAKADIVFDAEHLDQYEVITHAPRNDTTFEE